MIPASEALYFHNAPYAHIVAYQERERLERIERESRRAIEAVMRFPSGAAFRAALSSGNARWRAGANAEIDRSMAPLNDKQAARWALDARTNGGQSNG